MPNVTRRRKRKTLEQRFWDKVNKAGPTVRPELGPCWVWTGGKTNKVGGYGQIEHEGVHRLAHRVSFFLVEGRWPTPCCLHRCDNRLCVRYEHLFEGTKQENSDDMVSKGRNNSCRGEKHGSAKLTRKQVEEIRSLYPTGNFSQRELAKRFGVSNFSINSIIRRQGWV